MTKQWKINGNVKSGWNISWGYKGDAIQFPYFVGTSKTPKVWKTISGATKFGLKKFGVNSSNGQRN